MKIVLCASLKAHQTIVAVAAKLKKLGHQVIIPHGTKKIKTGAWQLKKLTAHKNQHKPRLLTNHFAKIKSADAVLVINQTSRGIKDYVGGNTLMEIGFAHYLNKPIYFLNPIPKMIYSEEIKAVKPVVINGDLKKITLAS